ncbi:MAG: hypothetical protein RIS75_1103 [Actinomycetota bacterium]|jgi:DNA helicase-2/ATP-dependent DNA helicase PcrA
MKYSAHDIAKAMKIDFLPEQLEAISADPIPGVIIAGAGSGKTAVMAARVVYLVANDIVATDQVLGLTFTKLAAGELHSRIRIALDALLGERNLEGGEDSTSGDPTVSTYHAFASRLVTEHGLRIGCEPDAMVITDTRRQQLAARSLQKTPTELATTELAFTTILERVLGLDDALSDYDVTPEALREWDHKLIKDLEVNTDHVKPVQKFIETSRARILLSELVEEFRENKKLHNAMDYADMGRFSLQLVRNFPDLVTQIRDQYRVVLLDEYQDTSIAQRNLMKELFGNGHPVTAVGDALQSIYAWRGASVWNIDQFPSDFPEANGKNSRIYGLPVTQRNGKNIVALANAITEPLRAAGQHDSVLPLEASESPRFGDGRVNLASFQSAQEEADWVVAQIKSAQSEGIALDDVALLLRNNNQVSWIYQALTAAGIPAQVRSKRALLNIPEVAEIIAVLRIVTEPTANSAWVRVLSGVRWRIGNRDLALIGKHAQRLAVHIQKDGDAPLEQKLIDAVSGSDPVDVIAFGDAIEDIALNGLSGLSAEALTRIRTLSAEVKHLRAHTSDDLADFVQRVASTIGLVAESAAHRDRVRVGFSNNLRSFFSMVAEFTSLDSQSTVFVFLQWLQDSDKYKSQPQLTPVVHKGSVQLMTVHSAKGLQFRVVGLPRFAKGIFPSSEGTSQWITNSDVVPVDLRDERKNEIIAAFPPRYERIATKPIDAFKAACKEQDDLDERRLAYVAITRSTDILFASSSAIADFDTQVREVSPYLVELKELVRESNLPVSIDTWFEFDDGDKPELPVVTGNWPVQLDSLAMTEIQQSAQRVLAAMAMELPSLTSSDPVVAQWDDAIDALNKELAQLREPLRTVELPKSLSVTHIQRLAKNAEEFVHDLVRPMPAKPAPAAAQGTAFHTWLEKRSSELMGRGHQPVLPGIEDIDEREIEVLDTPTLQKFRETFEKSPWSTRVPYAIEEPFGIMFGGHLIRGRIDAVFADEVDGRTVWTLVDWKTNSSAVADPLQLSIYRLAWAASKKVPLEDVKGAFYYVALDQTIMPEDLKTYEEVNAIIEAGYIPEL